MRAPYSIGLQNAYRELLDAKLDLAVSDLRGTPTRRLRDGRGYWYDRYRVGSDVRERYLGEDTQALRQRLDEAGDLAARRQDTARRCAELVAMLRAGRLLTLDQQSGSLLSAMERAGAFRLGGTLIGTQAFRLYGAELGRPVGESASHATADIDIASFEKLSVALADVTEPRLPELFRDFAFDPVPTLDPGRPAWRWRQTRGEAIVEFLTPSFEADEGIRPIATLDVSAQAFHFLNYLLSHPLPAVGLYRDGVLVQIPRPEKYAVHKMIVATRRRDTERLKAIKDILQAEALAEVMIEDRPYEIEQAFRDACGRGPSWRHALSQALERSSKLRALLGNFTDG